MKEAVEQNPSHIAVFTFFGVRHSTRGLAQMKYMLSGCAIPSALHFSFLTIFVVIVFVFQDRVSQ